MDKKFNLTLVFLLLLTNFNTWNATPNIILQDENQSSYFTPTSFTEHDPISIDGNSEFYFQSIVEKWPGDGSSANPYIIENLNISDGNLVEINFKNTSVEYVTGILINNVDYNFVIRNNHLSRPISIFNSKNGHIAGNKIVGDVGIVLNSTTDMVISNNSMICNLFCIDTLYSSELTFSKNMVYDGSWHTFQIFRSSYIYLFNNTISNREGNNALDIYYGKYIWITKNEIENSFSGIYSNASTLLEISQNNLIDNTQNSIYLEYTNESIIYSNEITSASGSQKCFYGIFLNNSHSNTFYFNHIHNVSNSGIYLASGANNTISTNEIHNSSTGLHIEASKTSITSNRIYNSSTGMIFSTTSRDNSVYWNNFIQNPIYNIFANGSSNFFTNNYYSNHTSPDSDGDTIVDNPYPIPGSTGYQDKFPRVIEHTLSDPVFTSDLGNSAVSGLIDISWVLSQSSSNRMVHYRLFYSLNGGMTWKDTGINTETDSTTWDTTSVENSDNVILRIVAIDDVSMYAHDYTSVFEIKNFEHTLTSPQITEPNGYETIEGDLAIKWKDSKDTNSIHQIKYDIYYSPDHGNSWETIALKQELNSYQWDTQKVENGDAYLIKVVANDGAGLTTEDRSDKPFTINNPKISSSQISSSTSSKHTSTDESSEKSNDQFSNNQGSSTTQQIHFPPGSLFFWLVFIIINNKRKYISVRN